MSKVSIIIPVYNVEPYIRKALDSCVHQTLSDIEIICIEDCSTDNSLEILNEYASKDSRFVIIQHEKNQGIGITRNDGMKIAKSDYIMFLDPDDWFELDACEKAYNQIIKNNDDVVFFNSQTTNKDEIVTSVNKKLAPFKDFLNGESFSLKNIKGNFVKGKIGCMTRIYNTEFIRRNDLYFSELRRGEDVIFAIRLFLLNPKVSVANYVLYNYRKQQELFIEKEINRIDDTYFAMRQAYDLIKQEEDNKYILKHFLVHTVIFCIKNRYENFRTNDYSHNNRCYKKSRELLKCIDKQEDAMKFYGKIDIVKYRLFILCPNSFIYETLYGWLADKAAVEKEHIIFTIGKIKLKLRIADKKFKKRKKVKG